MRLLAYLGACTPALAYHAWRLWEELTEARIMDALGSQDIEGLRWELDENAYPQMERAVEILESGWVGLGPPVVEQAKAVLRERV